MTHDNMMADAERRAKLIATHFAVKEDWSIGSMMWMAARIGAFKALTEDAAIIAAKDAEIARLDAAYEEAFQTALKADREIAALRAQVERMKRAIVDIVPEDDVTDSDEVEIGPVRRRKYWRNLAAATEKEPQS